jgi:hypothetical protein
MHIFRHKGCNSGTCRYRTFLTNSRNNVISGYTHEGFADYIGADFNRKAARDVCGWIWTNNLNVNHPKPLVNCYYTYG